MKLAWPTCTKLKVKFLLGYKKKIVIAVAGIQIFVGRVSLLVEGREGISKWSGNEQLLASGGPHPLISSVGKNPVVEHLLFLCFKIFVFMFISSLIFEREGYKKNLNGMGGSNHDEWASRNLEWVASICEKKSLKGDVTSACHHHLCMSSSYVHVREKDVFCYLLIFLSKFHLISQLEFETIWLDLV